MPVPPVGTHIAQIYGGLVPGSRMARGGLSPHQERRAKEMIRANLDGALSIDQIASAPGLSTSHFRRAFRQSTGSLRINGC
ncbi:MAG: helix-turn-helix transcriptional regulator [Sphingobium sp.]|nr:helix-turn-helix transcriptional regulator [Sphingobium sp.]